MSDLILQVGASKLAISVVLAIGIVALTRRFGRPALAHGLWLLLLAALLVPPLVSVPVLPPEVLAPVSAAPTHVAVGFLEAEPAPSAGTVLLNWIGAHGGEALVWLWVFGTMSVLGWTLVRTLRFHRSLVRASEEALPAVQRMARRLARRLGLESAPIVHVTPAQLSPMVWWAGGKVRVLIPSLLLAEMEASELDCVLAHELAHVRRRDHVIRWLEWLACSAFWWNPVAWWARRRMRAAEELCCDTLALASCDAAPRAYARSLLRAIDLVSARPSLALPPLASTAHGSGRAYALEERFKMIVANTPSPSLPPRLRTALRFGAVCLLATGLVYCNDQRAPIEPTTAPTPVAPDVAGPSDTLRSSESEANLDGPNRLYRNLVGWTLEDITEEAGVAAADRFATGVAVADLDHDGDFDLFVHALGRPNARYVNDGRGNFGRLEGHLGELVDALVGKGELRRAVGESLRRDVGPHIARHLDKTGADLFMSVSPADGSGEQHVVTVDLAGLREKLGETAEEVGLGVDILGEFVRVERASMSTLEAIGESQTTKCRGSFRADGSVDARLGTVRFALSCLTPETQPAERRRLDGPGRKR